MYVVPPPKSLVSKPSLTVVAAVLLGCAAASVAVEFVADALRARRLRVSGTYDAWQAKAQAVADAARQKSLLSGAAALKASNWQERNVAGAASEEDAKLIREMNAYLGVEANSGSGAQ